MTPAVNIPHRTRETKEFWKPERPTLLKSKKCHHCGNEMFLGSRFCHLCGAGPENADRSATRSELPIFDWKSLSDNAGLSVPAMVCGAIGVLCVLAALVTGMIFSASTALDWQAIQTWRSEWLLAALVAFVAGIYLKRR